MQHRNFFLIIITFAITISLAGCIKPYNIELVKRGLAWHYKFYSDDRRLADDEDNARLKKLGLWGGSHKVIAPWDWRKLSRVERDELR